MSEAEKSTARALRLQAIENDIKTAADKADRAADAHEALRADHAELSCLFQGMARENAARAEADAGRVELMAMIRSDVAEGAKLHSSYPWKFIALLTGILALAVGIILK